MNYRAREYVVSRNIPMAKLPITFYSYKEEIFNVISHLVGLVLSVAGLALLVTFASIYGTVWHIVSFSIFGSTMVVLYLASTLYHAAKRKALRKKLNVFDHSAIYLLIAGTYTPYCLVTLNGALGWVLLGVVWALALTGIILKIFFTGRYDRISTIAYVLMGWVGVFAARPMVENLQLNALTFLIIGGMSYTIGAIFYSIRKMPYNHAIFHVWVLLGTISHFFSIFYLL